jgi:hypothetical protein
MPRHSTVLETQYSTTCGVCACERDLLPFRRRGDTFALSLTRSFLVIYFSSQHNHLPVTNLLLRSPSTITLYLVKSSDEQHQQ